MLLTAAISVAAESAPAKPEKQAARTIKAPGNNPLPDFAPMPSWAKPEVVPPANPKHKDDPLQFLLSSSQEYLTPSGLENTVEYVVQPQNQAGLQAIGTVAIPWNVDRTTLSIHHVDIVRDGKTIDALNREDISVIRRETKLEQSTLNGIRTVVLPVKGLQVGDQLKVAFSYKTKPRTIGKIEEVQDMVLPMAVARTVRRFALSDGLTVRWMVDPSIKEIRGSKAAGTTERAFAADGFEHQKEIKFKPERFAHSLIQVSTYENWDEVAQPLIPLFDTAARTEPNSTVIALADKIAATHASQLDRMLAALRAVQDDVRYVALLLGDGDYKPMAADDVWKQRFGDCKGKTALLMALLERLKVPAEPMLAAVKNDDGLNQRLPTLALFDHVFIRAHIAGETYYLDGTNLGQRTPEELRQSPTRHGLPLVAKTQLITTPDIMPSKPLYDTLLVWDGSKGIVSEVPFEATLTLRGPVASEMRVTASTTEQDKLIEGWKNKLNGVANDALEFVSTEPDSSDGSFIVHFKGTAGLDWNPVDGLKGNRFQFSQSTVNWDGELGRDDDDVMHIPVLLAYPYWERTTETLRLPEDGKAFFLDGKAIDQTIAATHITRTLAVSGTVISSVSDFKRLGRELPAAEARSAKPLLTKVRSDFAYVVAKKKLKLPN